MSPSDPVTTDHQLARLLQVGIVLEEVIEAQTYQQHETLGDDTLDEEVVELLDHAADESRDHRHRLEKFVDELDPDPVAYDKIEQLFLAHHDTDTDLEGILRDQRWGEETAYTYYDTLISAIESSSAEFSVDRDRLVDTLREIRAEERRGVEKVTELIEARNHASDRR